MEVDLSADPVGNLTLRQEQLPRGIGARSRGAEMQPRALPRLVSGELGGIDALGPDIAADHAVQRHFPDRVL